MLMEMVIDGVEIPGDANGVDPADAALARSASGDQAAFAELYDMLSGRVFGLILRVLVDRSQSEEVLQEVFLEVWESARSFDPDRGIGAFDVQADVQLDVLRNPAAAILTLESEANIANASIARY